MGYRWYNSYRRIQPPRRPAPIHPVSWRFLDFPGDIRNLIYHHLLVDNAFDPECWIRQRHRRKHLFPEIMRTCQQIHDEAVYILYGRNYFTIEINYDKIWSCEIRCTEAWQLLCWFNHAPLMQNWRILLTKSGYTGPDQVFCGGAIPWKLRMMCMKFQSLKISVGNLFVYVEDYLPLINLPQLHLLSPLKELRVRGKISIEMASQHLAPRESAVQYFQNMKAIMKPSTKVEGLNVNLQEDAMITQSQFFIQDLETVTKIFQENVDDDRYLTDLDDILRMLGRDRAKGVLQNPKRLVRKELCQYLGLLEDIFNSILRRRMRTRSSFDFNESDRDLRAMSQARRWLYMRPEYLAWIQHHDRNALYSRGPIYYQEGYWTEYRSHDNKNSNHPSFSSSSYDKPKPAKGHPWKSSSPSSSSENIKSPPSRTTKIDRPRNPNERHAITLEDIYSAEEMPLGLRSARCTFKFQVSRRQHRGTMSLKTHRRKKSRKRKWVGGGGGGGEKLGDCLDFYEECFW